MKASWMIFSVLCGTVNAFHVDFEYQYETGQYANNDTWVQGRDGGVWIAGWSPAPTQSPRKNGIMINPSPVMDYQCYDSEMPAIPFHDNLPASFFSGEPIFVTNGSSVVFSETFSTPQPKNQVKKMWVITIVMDRPHVGDFRPPYSSQGRKESKFNINDICWDKLKNLTPTASVPTFAEMESRFTGPTMDRYPGQHAPKEVPIDQMNWYWRERGRDLGMATLLLNTNAAQEEKEALLYDIIQVGVDLFGIIQNGGQKNWVNNGGIAQGRKMPILFTGVMLDDPRMKGIGEKSGDYLYSEEYGPSNPPPDYIHFGEDDQTFYVSILDVNATTSSSWNYDSRDDLGTPYTINDIGMPEWGIRHATDVYRSNKWLPTIYRGVAGTVFHSHALTAEIMGFRRAWRHEAFFEYTERYMGFTRLDGEYYQQDPNPSYAVRSMDPFTEEMWDEYHN